MDIPQLDYTTQALGRLAQQYVDKPKLRTRLSLIASAAQDIDSCIRAIADRLNVAIASWAGSTTYNVGALVAYQGSYYVCTGAVTGGVGP